MMNEQEHVDYIASLWIAEEAGTAPMAQFTAGPFTAYTIIGALQLAMRHPDMSSLQRGLIQQAVDQISALFAGGPAEELIKMGSDPAYDVPPQRYSGGA